MTTINHSHLVMAPAGGGDLPNAPAVAVQLTVHCHRNRRGPYTGAADLVRRIVPDLLGEHVDLVSRRSTEVLALAPDLAPLLPPAPVTLTQAASREERTRYYPAARTRRLAQGIAGLLLDWARIQHPGGVTIAFLELDHADPTDRELVSVLLPRCEPGTLRLLLQASPANDELGRVMAGSTRLGVAGNAADIPTASVVESDGITEDALAWAEYRKLDEDERARQHAARAAALRASAEPGTHLGALLYHLERAGDPGAAATQFVAAAEECFERGFYDAALDLTLRARVLFGADRPKAYWSMTNKVGACMCYLGRAEESLAYFAELRRGTIDPDVHMNTAYMLAMIYTRHLPAHLRDQDLALEWVNNAIAIADRQPDKHRKAFHGAFMRNARALVELRRGDLGMVMSLLREAIALTDADLAHDEHMLHRSVLVYNRAQVYAAMGDHDAALIDYDEILSRDPYYGDYFFERAGERRAAGRFEEALADYASAIQFSPPFHEAHFNRADLLIELGLGEQALPDLDYALELEPDHLDSLVNRADLLLGLGLLDQAGRDIERGLTLDPRNANLLAARGNLFEETGDTENADQNYSLALEANPAYLPAWVNRAVLRYSQGQPEAAIADLTAAIELDDSAFLRANRAIAFQDMGDHDAAIADLNQAIDSLGGDDPDLLYRRGASRLAQRDELGALTDWQAHLARFDDGEESPYAAEIERLSAGIRQAEVVAG